MISPKNSPMEFLIVIKRECPYCKMNLNLICNKRGENFNTLTYFYCKKCKKGFVKIYLPREMFLGVFQLTTEQKKTLKRRYKERFKDGE